MRKSNQRLKVYLADVFKEQIEHFEKSQSLFTADNYANVYRSVSEFMGKRVKKFCVDEITTTWLNSYLLHLNGACKLSPGSVDNYLRILCALYNKAVKEHSIPVGAHPFSDIHILVPDTLKRSLEKEDILRVIDIDLSGKGELCKACDLFMFLFYARGMCFVDVFNLRYDAVEGNHISYRRSKTSAPLQVKIVEEMKVIMERYREDGNPYVFPFLHRNQYTGKEISERSALRRINRQLGQIGKVLGLTLTTYVARHSWASLVEECGMSIAIISQGMGHSSERVTKIYMKGMPSHVIDNANEEMLNRLIRKNTVKLSEDKKDVPFFVRMGHLEMILY